mmetsp:Transcript_18981/g.39544  ORF Transcript_18981/g.39544 Transcript_18981/m.39544 type:complete len:208 (-) Transcript_18981:1797-2420(-)
MTPLGFSSSSDSSIISENLFFFPMFFCICSTFSCLFFRCSRQSKNVKTIPRNFSPSPSSSSELELLTLLSRWNEGLLPLLALRLRASRLRDDPNGGEEPKKACWSLGGLGDEPSIVLSTAACFFDHLVSSSIISFGATSPFSDPFAPSSSFPLFFLLLPMASGKSSLVMRDTVKSIDLASVSNIGESMRSSKSFLASDSNSVKDAVM